MQCGWMFGLGDWGLTMAKERTVLSCAVCLFSKAREGILLKLCFALFLGSSASSLVRAENVTYIYTDPQGTPLVEADSQGNIITLPDHRPYGNHSGGEAINGPGYTGHVEDDDSGLIYMQARFYDPLVGRFLSVDPVGPQAGNIFNLVRFAYVSNNPIMLSDPTGKLPKHGQDMDICGGVVPCDYGGGPRLKVVYPFVVDNTAPSKDQLKEEDRQPSRMRVLGSYRDADCSACYEVWRYQVTNKEDGDLKGDGYQIKEHIQMISSTDEMGEKTSESTFINASHGTFFDHVGLTPGTYASLPDGYQSVSIYRQTFTIRYGGSITNLSTVFDHKVTVSNGNVNTTTEVVRP